MGCAFDLRLYFGKTHCILELSALGSGNAYALMTPQSGLLEQLSAIGRASDTAICYVTHDQGSQLLSYDFELDRELEIPSARLNDKTGELDTEPWIEAVAAMGGS